MPDRLHGRAGARRSDPAQQPARHLHQFRQPARSLRARGAGLDARRRRAVRRHAARARRPRRAAGVDRPRVPRRHRRCRSAPPDTQQPPLADARVRGSAPTRSRSRWSARISPACRSTANCARSARASWRRPRPRRTIGCSRSGTRAAEARPAAGRGRQGRGDRGRSLGAVAPRASAASSPRCRRRCRSAPCACRTAATVKGFLVEAEAVDGARDISAFGGWRAFMAQAEACRHEAAHR